MKTVGDYLLGGALGRGGMSTVLLGLHLPTRRMVALKRLLPHVLADADLCATLSDEARLARSIHHPNVVAIIDVIDDGAELVLVMEAVDGASVGALRGDRERVPPAIASAITQGTLRGLAAAHDAVDERGAPLHIVHRDISPANLLVGRDGHVRVADFGVAKALGRVQQTREGVIKGKVSYMAPEQLLREEVTRTADVFATCVVLWELLSGERLFAGETAVKITEQLLYQRYQPLRDRVPSLPESLDTLLARGLARAPGDRFPTARALEEALVAALPPAPPSVVAAFVATHGAAPLAAFANAQAAFTGCSNECRRPGPAGSSP